MMKTSEQFELPPKMPDTIIEMAWTPTPMDAPRADGLFPEFQGERLLVTTKNDLDQLTRRLKGEKWIALFLHCIYITWDWQVVFHETVYIYGDINCSLIAKVAGFTSVEVLIAVIYV